MSLYINHDDTMIFVFQSPSQKCCHIYVNSIYQTLLTSEFRTTLLEYSTNCCLLEKITCHNITYDSYLSVDVYEMRSFKNLKEIYMDNSVFNYYYHDQENYTDLNKPTLNQYFMFRTCCCKNIERVSIRNAKWHAYMAEPTIIPQNAF